MKSTTKSIEMLFVSKVRIKALKFFLMNPNDSIHLRGAVREFKEEINAVRRELLRMVEMDLLQITSQGNRKYFKLNAEHPFINDLFGMFHKSYGLGAQIIKEAKNLGTIDYAMLTPSYTKQIFLGTDQVIDLAIVGIVDLEKLNEIIKKYENDRGKEIHYTVLKPSEFETRRRRKDDFLINLMNMDLVMLVGRYENFIRK